MVVLCSQVSSGVRSPHAAVFVQRTGALDSGMPTVLRVAGYRFFFFSNERREPAHIHVERAEAYAKFWLTPVSLAGSPRVPQRRAGRGAAPGRGAPGALPGEVG